MCKFVLGRYSVFVQKVLFVIPVSLESPRPGVVQVVLDRGRNDGRVLGQTQSDLCGMELLGKDLRDGPPQTMDFDVGTQGEGELLNRGEGEVRNLRDHGQQSRLERGVGASCVLGGLDGLCGGRHRIQSGIYRDCTLTRREGVCSGEEAGSHMQTGYRNRRRDLS